MRMGGKHIIAMIMAAAGLTATILMRKIDPDNKAYPIYAALVVTLFVLIAAFS